MAGNRAGNQAANKAAKQVKRGPRVSTRRALLLILFFGFTLLVVTRFANLRDLLRALLREDPAWAAIAIAIHVFFFFLYAVLYQACFKVVGVKSRAIELFPVTLSSVFVNAVLPIGGAGGGALFIDYADRHGESGAKAAVGVMLTLIADLVTLLPFLFYGVIYLVQQGQLKIYLIFGVASFLFFVLGLSGILILARSKPEWTRRLFGWLQRLINRLGGRLHRPSLVADGWADENAAEFSTGAEAISENPRAFSLALLTGVFLHLVNLAGLYAFFRAFRQPVSPGTLMAAFSLGVVVFVVTIIPESVGAVEAIMGLVFVDSGIPSDTAAAIVFSFRGVNFWLPVLFGLVFLEGVTLGQPKDEPGEEPAGPPGTIREPEQGGAGDRRKEECE